MPRLQRLPRPLPPDRTARAAAAAGRWLRLAALAPLALAALSAAPAQAQSHCDATDPYEVWCATITVGQHPTEMIFGYQTSGHQFGSSTPGTFTWRGNTIAVSSFSYEVNGNLLLNVSRELGGRPSDGYFGPGEFRLEIGTGAEKSFTFVDPVDETVLNEANHGLSWSVNDAVPVRLVAINVPATGFPEIAGTPRVGYTLTAGGETIADGNGVPGASGVSYQWFLVDGDTETAIIGATAPTYRLGGSDAGKKVKVRMSFVDDAGFNESRTSLAYPDEIDSFIQARDTATGDCEPWNPNELWCGTITVDEYVVQGITAFGYSTFGLGSLSPNTFTRNGATIRITRLTRFTAGGVAINGNVERVSGTTPSDGLLGDPGKLMFEFGGRSFTFSTATNTGFSISRTPGLPPWTDGQAVPFRVIQTPNTPATGNPWISGTPTSGETLTASRGSIADADGAASEPGKRDSYQWIRVDSGTDSDISGATSASYTLQQADEGKTVKVTLSFTDTAGNRESRTSDAYPATGDVAAGAAPGFVSATASGTKLRMVYDKPLDTGSVPAGGAFAVTVANEARTLAGTDPVAIAGRTVTLTLSSAVTALQAVTVAYTKPASNPI